VLANDPLRQRFPSKIISHALPRSECRHL
jgi:hypothetical protein